LEQSKLDTTRLIGAAYRSSSAGLMVLDVDGTVLEANAEAVRWCGPLEFGEANFPEWVGDWLLNAFFAEVQAGTATNANLRLLKGGRECQARLIAIQEEAQTLVMCTLTPTTEPGRPTTPTEFDQERLQRLVEYAPVPIQFETFSETLAMLEALRAEGVTDLRKHLEEHPDEVARLISGAKVLISNQAAYRHVYDRGFLDLDDVAASQVLVARLADATRQAFLNELVAIWEGKLTVSIEIDELSRTGEPRSTVIHWNVPEIAGVPAFDEVMVVIQDVTELRSTQRQLEAHLKSKDRFVASVAHELRTPLTAVVGLANLLVDGQLDEQDLAEIHQTIASQSNELAGLIDDLLVIARGDLSEVKVVMEPVDVSTEAAAVVKGHDWTAQVALDLEPAPALADPKRLRQIIRNLVSNAIRYGGASVEVTTRSEGSLAILEVADDGPELSPADRERMFLPYERIRQENVPSGSIGLGLAVARTLAGLMGGTLDVTRTNGRNVFRLMLPR
jgi:signal transduction histidine kinase